MFCVSKKLKISAVLSLQILAVGSIALLSQAGPLAADPAASNTKWSVTLETESEFAYRSVYERSLKYVKRTQATARRHKPSQMAVGAVRKTPEVPSRKAEAKSASPPVRQNGAAAKKPVTVSVQNIFDQPLEDIPALPLIHRRPRSVSNAFTTQVLGDENQQTAPEAASEPAPAPRNRGDQYCTNMASAATGQSSEP